jgi:transposase
MYLATTQLVDNNPVFKQWYEHNVHNKHMKKQRSIFKLLGKLARVLIGIVQRGEAFSPDKAGPIYDQAA